MAVKYSVDKHATALPSKVLAREGGAHIFNIKLTSATDNGNFVGKGTYIGLDQYAEVAAPAGFAGTVVAQAANGNYYVEVTANPNHALFVYQEPINPYESPRDLASIGAFYNEKDDTVRCYDVQYGDILEISVEGFSKKPEVTNTVSIANKKLVPAG